MGQWFPTLDAAVGGTADAVTDSGDWVLGGIGSTIGNTVTGAADVTGDATGSLLGGLFGGLGRWMLIAGGLTLSAIVLMKVI